MVKWIGRVTPTLLGSGHGEIGPLDLVLTDFETQKSIAVVTVGFESDICSRILDRMPRVDTVACDSLNSVEMIIATSPSNNIGDGIRRPIGTGKSAGKPLVVVNVTCEHEVGDTPTGTDGIIENAAHPDTAAMEIVETI